MNRLLRHFRVKAPNPNINFPHPNTHVENDELTAFKRFMIGAGATIGFTSSFLLAVRQYERNRADSHAYREFTTNIVTMTPLFTVLGGVIGSVIANPIGFAIIGGISVGTAIDVYRRR